MFMVAAFVVVVVACTTMLTAHWPSNAPTIVATINGEAIDRREFMLFFARSRSLTLDYFKRRYNADDGPVFWTHSYEGEIPLEHAKSLAMQALVRAKVQQQLAREYGLVTDTSYRAFLQALTSENNARERTVRNGGVIYGPRQYGEDSFYQEYMAKLAVQVQERWAHQLNVPGDALTRFYEDHKAALYTTKAGQFMPFAEVEQHVLQAYCAAEYQQFIDQQVSRATITFDTVNFQQIPGD